ncbi:hypothetical protein [Paraburkholderia sp. SIMBA_054]|uniref:hypothetical protein n=1 Tax=Paraburkholderia sp. SIMBA_054 TaxID=3085795 RepID=UPI00397923CB
MNRQTDGKNAESNEPVARPAKHADVLAQALTDLVQAVEFSPLGVGAIKAVAAAKAVLQKQVASHWSPLSGAMSDEQYIAHRGMACPSCGSRDIGAGSMEADGDSATQDVSCRACGGGWADVYKLAGYSDLDGGIDTEAVEAVVIDVRDRASKYGFSIDTAEQAREVVAETCDLLDSSVTEREREIAVNELTS